jgi:DMSO/TMAO reductase YedYZ heme-binding membrane subunit
MFGLTVTLMMVALRLVIPLALTALLVWALKRLDAHWQNASSPAQSLRAGH